MSLQKIPETVKVGDRIQVKLDRATIRYIGTVAKSSGEWLGVEWDDPARGKHDGSHGGIRYFECSSPTAGSFIRYHPEKVITGTTFMEAMKDKYLDPTTGKGAYVHEEDVGFIYLGGNKSIEVETVGFDKIQRTQSEFNNLTVVGLAELCISAAGEPGDINKYKLAIEDVDLSRNLIKDWDTIADIISQLSELRLLRLNNSRLAPLPTDIHSLYRGSQSPFANLTTLGLNNSGISWEDILRLEPLIASIEDLQVGNNKITSLSGKENTQKPIFQKLKWLNLELNELEDWDEVITNLGNLPSLEILFLNENKFSNIKPCSSEQFMKLDFLRIDSNLMNNWESVNSLNSFHSLTRLRCNRNPIFNDMDVEDVFFQVVGRVGGLAMINGNTMTGREKSDMERFYLKNCVKDGKTHDEIAAIHPRYKELCEIHGEPDLGGKAFADGFGKKLKDRLVGVKFSRYSISSEELLAITDQKVLPAPVKSIEKRVLLTMLVRNARRVIQKLLQIPAERQSIFLLHNDYDGKGAMVMDISDDMRDLKFYGISEGDEIIVLDNA
ncbi:hypothetical protein J3Q64DRAFT_1725187 [Phycomyces blakesleeanus]|uniref:CAP-Gly domain-containing protein n=2 Tax=Phycomyces blakesleeanus TaxID=4837 RepID=A0A167R1Z9_PHYB8|nr:hypothetical protein PHYBLDRAFT_178699 [Phycomyces blakesleeanus NRRL 1555(-)]OAD80664.1 hypothetical protein PHYBLDRAFT_178699 [Phycomyces blakesleeanus NRRL 1555(-)]|eukprot:XP_018298704.1 hypothetical protein PHYBLDRAFT_178699 [Phycomyces blakesleeanus NRRL 1555(-)]